MVGEPLQQYGAHGLVRVLGTAPISCCNSTSGKRAVRHNRRPKMQYLEENSPECAHLGGSRRLWRAGVQGGWVRLAIQNVT